MGYRNPVTSATAVDTHPGGGGVRMYQQSGAYGGAGIVEFDDAIGDVGSLIMQSNYFDPGDGSVTTQGGDMSLTAPAWNANKSGGPSLHLKVVEAPAGGYQSIAELDADVIQANGALLAFPRALGDVIGTTDPTAGAANTVVAAITRTVPSGLPAGTKIKVVGTGYLVTPTGVGAVLTVGGNARVINQGSMLGDVTVVFYDPDLTPGPRTWQMLLRSTVAGQTVTCRRPAMQTEIV